MLKKYWPLGTIYLLVLAFYYPVFSTFFSHDDFFHFKVSQTDGTIGSFINLFGFHPFAERGIAFYRPLFREVLYNIGYSIFGLNALPFRFFSIFLHFVNIYLVFVLFQKLFKNKFISFCTSLFFGVSAANVATLYYLAGGIQSVGATLFILASLIFFLNYLEKDGNKHKTLSFVAYVAALASMETAAIIPVLLAGLIWVKNKKNFSELWPFILLFGIYLYLDYTKIGFSENEAQYKAVFSVKTTINTLSWYFAWALGIPEMLVDFVLPGLKLNPSLMKHWDDYFNVIFPSLFISLLILFLNGIYLLFNKANVFKNKTFWFLFIWFPLSLLPVIFLPQHKSTHYEYLSLPAFWGVIFFIVYNYYQLRKEQITGKVLVVGLIIVLLLLNFTSALLGKNTYIAAQRGLIANKLIKDMQTKYPTLPAGAVVYFQNDPDYPFIALEWGKTSKQAALVLNNEDALQLYYKDQTLRVFYEDLGGIPVGVSRDNVFPLVARLQ